MVGSIQEALENYANMILAYTQWEHEVVKVHGEGFKRKALTELALPLRTQLEAWKHKFEAAETVLGFVGRDIAMQVERRKGSHPLLDTVAV